MRLAPSQVTQKKEYMRVDSAATHAPGAQMRAVRALGSCALDLCSVACGRADAMYEVLCPMLSCSLLCTH